MLSVGNRTFRTPEGSVVFTMKEDTVGNTETPTPTTVGFYRRDYVPPYDFSTENAAIYCRIDHRPGETDFRYWVYGEITEQSLVGGSFTKVMHRGAGDAHYVALLGNGPSGYGYEAAGFGGWQDSPTNTIPKQENLFLGSFQGAGGFQESVKNQGNTVCFHALVHDDGADPTDPDLWATNYGLFYANNSLSNAFVVRVSEFAQNFAQFKVMDHTANQRPCWEVFGDGQMRLSAPEATSGTQNQNPPNFTLRGKYWDGAAEDDYQVQLSFQVANAPTPDGTFRIDIGEPGSETLAFQVTNQGHTSIPGNMTLFSDTATSGSQNENPPVVLLQGSYWDGAAAQSHGCQISYQVTGAPSPTGTMVFTLGATLAGQLTDVGDLTIANNITMSGATFRIAGARTIAAYDDPGNGGDMCSDANYLYRHNGTQWTRIAWDASTW